MDWSSVITTLLSAAFGGLVVSMFILKGSTVRVSEFSLLGLKLSIVNFKSLSVFKAFENVTLAFFANNDDALLESSVGKNPNLLISFGWSVVCDAYVERFQETPNDESLESRTKDLGAQNIAFIRAFRDLANAAMSKNIDFETAKEYCFRCPSLADRISPHNSSLHLKKLSSQIKELKPYEIKKAYNIFRVIEMRKDGFDGSLRSLVKESNDSDKTRSLHNGTIPGKE